MNTVAILLCGGSSNRMRGEVRDKVLAELDGRLVFDHSLLAFEEVEEISSYLIVYKDPNQREELESRIRTLTKKSAGWVRGGSERQESVINALESLADDTNFVLIHDCARPLVHPEALQDVYLAVVKDKSACLAHRSIDTIKETSVETSALRQLDLKNLQRNRLWAMETPQAFAYKIILGAYRKLKEDGIKVTDDAAAVIHYGYQVTLVENLDPNPKITFPEDLKIAELILQLRRDKT